MRRRPSSRLLVIDRNDRILLFRFKYNQGPLAGQDYWATPGGGLEENETFEEAARRELFEETGISISAVGNSIAKKEFILQLPDGEQVIAEERFFVIREVDQELSRHHRTLLENEVMVDQRWWALAELTSTDDLIFPENLAEILENIGVGTEE